MDARPAGKGPFGTEQQAGNVREWVCGRLDMQAYTKAPRGDDPSVTITDPLVGCDSTDGAAYRVYRGGSFNDSAEKLRSANRFWIRIMWWTNAWWLARSIDTPGREWRRSAGGTEALVQIASGSEDEEDESSLRTECS